MKVDKIYQAGYATIIEANGGEEQLTVLISGGQNGRAKVVAVRTQVDYGMWVLHNDHHRVGKPLGVALEQIIREWHKPNAIGRSSNVEETLRGFFKQADPEGWFLSLEPVA